MYAGAKDSDPFNDDGLLRVYRKSYSDGAVQYGPNKRLYDNDEWQEGSVLPKRGAPEVWPRQLYHYGVEDTDGDLNAVSV